jgi:hypothetical protein
MPNIGAAVYAIMKEILETRRFSLDRLNHAARAARIPRVYGTDPRSPITFLRGKPAPARLIYPQFTEIRCREA